MLLPRTDTPEVQQMADEDPNFLSAYRVCLQREREFAANPERLRYVRILGFLLLHGRYRGLRVDVTKCIHSCKDDDHLVSLGEFFERHLIFPFMKNRARTPKTSDHPSRPSFEVVENQMKADITQSPKDHRVAKKLALIRDNWRCVVTGMVQQDAPPDIQAQINPQTTYVGFTECAHIIPVSTFSELIPKIEDNYKLDNPATLLAVLKHFRIDISTFNGEKAHSLTNIITMDKIIHDHFDRLSLYFESTPRENHYEVKTFASGVIHLGLNRFVMFSTPDPDHLPVPAPHLLALHATCCKIAHFSGAAEHIDQVYRDADDIGVLANDGTSGDILSYALSSLSNNVVGVQMT